MKRLYEITVAGSPQCYRDIKAIAIGSAEYFKRRNPAAEVAIRDLDNGEIIVIDQMLRLRRP